jgi:diguanylate cyclase (GGDEF)-like protein
MSPQSAADSALHDVIESIVMLTEQRDQRSLEHSLFSSLQEMLEPKDCWLLSRDADEVSLRVVAGDSGLLPGDLIQPFAASRPEADFQFVEHAGKNYLIARTLSSEDDNLRLLVIARTQWEADDQRLVQGMLKVYQNFVTLLRDSEKDTLTGLYNRRKLEAKLGDIMAATLRGRRYKDHDHSDYLAVLDIDRFKRVNDTYGHLIGDETLLTFANILRRTLRDDDLIFRYGGEEFIVLLQELSDSQTDTVLERVRRNVEKHDFAQVGRVTVSIGYTSLKAGLTPNQVIEEADRALYYAKQNGRNQLRSYPALIAAGELRVHQDNKSAELF